MKIHLFFFILLFWVTILPGNIEIFMGIFVLMNLTRHQLFLVKNMIKTWGLKIFILNAT